MFAVLDALRVIQVAAAQPDALAGFVRFTEALKAALPDDLSEIVALTVAAETGNDYERIQHQRLGLTLGLGEMWVRSVLRLDPDSDSEMTAAQRSVQRLVLSMVRTLGRQTDADLAVVETFLAPTEVVGVLLMACRYIAHAAFANTLHLISPVDSLFDAPDQTQAPPPTQQGNRHG